MNLVGGVCNALNAVRAGDIAVNKTEFSVRSDYVGFDQSDICFFTEKRHV